MAGSQEPSAVEKSALSLDKTSDAHEAEKVQAQASDFPEGGLRAWMVAMGAGGIAFCTVGQVNAFGIFQTYYESHELAHESSSSIAWIGSLQAFFIFLASVVGGGLFDRYGAVVIWPPAFFLVFAMMMTSLCTEYYQFILAQGVLTGICMGMCNTPAFAATAHWFQKKRGLAMGCAIGGSSLGGVIYPIVATRLLNNSSLGFGWTMRILAFMTLAVILPATLAIKARLPPRKTQFLLLSALKNVQFLTLTGAVICMWIGLFTLFFFLPTWGLVHGMSEDLSSYLISILNAASFFGRIIPGALSDKFGRRNILALAGLSSGILILCWPETKSSAFIIVIGALYGFTSGAIISGAATSFATAAEDPKQIGAFLGMGLGLASVAILIGPPVNGALIGDSDGFRKASIFSGVFVLVGGLITVWVRWQAKPGIFARA